MSDLGDIFNFQKYLGKDVFKKWKDNPERAVLGINTPLESKLWGGILGKNYEPTIDMFGGNTENQARGATASGINTGPGEKVHDVARAIASIIAGGYGAGQLGMFGGGAGATGGASAAGGASMPAAVPESASTLSRWGMTQSSPGVWDRVGGSGAAAPAWSNWIKQSPGQQQQQPRPPEKRSAAPMSDPYGLVASGLPPEMPTLTPQEEQRLKVLSALMERGGMRG